MITNGPRIGILGGGIVGIITALLLFDMNPIIISPDLGGSWGKGGLKLLKYHLDIDTLFKRYDIQSLIFNVTGGVLWKGQLLDLEDAPEEAQAAHYLKTRGTMDGFSDTCMNNKAGTERCFEFKYDDFIDKSAEDLTQFEAHVKQVVLKDDHKISVSTDRGAVFDFDYVLTSIPLPQMRNILLNHTLPMAEFKWLNVASFQTIVRSPWKRMYIYLPEGDGPHRISRTGLLSKIWTMETTDDVCTIGKPKFMADEYWAGAVSNIRKMFPDATYLKHIGRMPGHLLPFDHGQVAYPDRILPIGRFASWEPRETLDVVADKVAQWRKTLWT